MNKKIKGIALIMITTLLARALGFVREIIIAFKFGTTIYSDAFITALSIPDLIITGFCSAICALYVPLYMEVFEKDKEEAKKFNSTTSVILLTISIIAIVLFLCFTEFFVGLFVSGFDEQAMQLTCSLTKIIIISCIPSLLAQHYSAYTQVKQRYWISLLIGCVINISIIIALFICTTETMSILALCVVLGNVLNAVIMCILVFRMQFRYSAKPNFKSEYFKKLLIGILPVLFSNLVFEINQIVDKNFASTLDSGTVSALNYSSKIINLITAIIGTSIATYFYPLLVSAYKSEDKDNLNKNVLALNNSVVILVLPILIFVVIYAENIIHILFVRGEFSDSSARITTQCLQFYSIGILGFNLKAIWIRVFNAELNTKIPAINSLVAVLLNIVLNFALINSMKHMGLALATGISSIITDVLLIIVFKIKHKNFQLGKLLFDFCKIILCSSLFLILLLPAFLLNLNKYVELIIGIILFLIIFVVYGFSLLLVKNSIILELYNKIKLRKKNNEENN